MSREGIDEAFAVFGDIVQAYTSLDGALVDREAGVRMTIEEISVESPLELSLYVGADGRVTFGCAPPLYDVDTTIVPVLHTLRFRAVAEGRDEGREPADG